MAMAMTMATETSDLINSFKPTTWVSTTDEVELHELPEDSEEFKSVARKVNSTLTEEIESIIQVQNPFLWGCYQFKKSEYQAKGTPIKEMELFHCTAASNIESIASDNLDWRRTSRSKFGQGVSFSPSAEYANKYANFDIGTDRAMILCHVLVGRERQGSGSMNIPPVTYDTTTGNNNMVYVKYYDYEFYPSYVAYYTCSMDPRFRERTNCYGDLYGDFNVYHDYDVYDNVNDYIYGFHDLDFCYDSDY